ncbi:TonB-dependent receptor [Oceanicoccus sagamiensis]|uniref:TonB-dependent receptor n=1 Tax=Oceanicoccus sagamiensis TaxID=716816 RepID=A0A1X9N6L9_9GAMM|nr:TonB-dependent receptor [Oceanicoccus sagamiensis]ARN73346.1 hypothetical protein BST96_04020 [Oceanicoccus sagamiensis]
MIKRSAPLRRSKLTLAIAMATLTTTAPTFAQEGLFVEEILVTARKQTESLQDVPLALSAFSANEIETLAIESTEDVIKLTPGLTYTRGIGGQDLRPDIRGLTPLSGRANIAILVDGVDITSDALQGTGAGQTVALGLYDLERIEVVRGPQSALFGRNAFGGAINYITKKPSSEFEGSINLEAAEWETYKAKASLSGPITDNILYRLNIAHSETGGQYDNPSEGNRLGEEEVDSISVALQFLPTDDIEILTRLDYSDQEMGHTAVGYNGANACFTEDYDETVKVVTNDVTTGAPVDVRDCDTAAGENAGARFYGTTPDFDESQIGLSDDSRFGTETEQLQWTTLVSYEFADDYTFTSNTAYTDMEGTDSFDLDYSPTVTSVGDCIGFAPAFVPGSCSSQGLPNFQLSSLAVFPWVDGDNPFNYISDRDYEREVIFQDFRLSFDAGDDVRWLVGLEYYYEETNQDDYSAANGSNLDRNGGTVTGKISAFPPPAGTVVTQTWDGSPFTAEREVNSFGIYGSYDWMFQEDWEISLSFRYQEEEFDIEYDNSIASGLVPTLVDPLTPVTKADGDYDAFNPRVVLTHYLNDDIMLYGSVSKGTKPGGHTIEPDISAAPGADVDKLTYDQEELTSYEFGWKTSWMNDRFIANGALFLMDNTDKQANNREYVTVSGTPRSFVDNIGETEIQGLELQLVGAVNEYWTATLNYAFIETEVTDFQNQSAYGIPSPPRGTPADEATRLALADPDADQSGNDLPYTPKHNLQLSNNFDFAVGDEFDGYLRIDGRFMSERYLSTDNLSKVDDAIVWDIKAGITNGVYEVTAYLDNVENEDAPASAITFPRFAENLRDQALVYPRAKRTAGVRFKYNF